MLGKAAIVAVLLAVAEDDASVVAQDSLLLMTQCQTNLARNLHLVPQIAALTIVPEARPLPR